MAIAVPPWVLAPEFTWLGARLPGAGPQRRFLTPNPARVCIYFSNMAGTLQVAPSQQWVTNGPVFAIPNGIGPYRLHFDDVGGMICSEWWDTGILQFDYIEIMWRPKVKGRV